MWRRLCKNSESYLTTGRYVIVIYVFIHNFTFLRKKGEYNIPIYYEKILDDPTI